MAAPVRYERFDSAALLTIDRPHRRNAVDGETAQLLLEGFRSFEADDEARVLILTGAVTEGEKSPAFCAGADLKAIETLNPFAIEGPLGFTRLTASKPTVAAVEGWCLAGGLELACWCDLRVATESSTFGLPERRWGVPLLDGGTQRLPRIVGLGRALDLVLTGRMVKADEALAMGLIAEIVPEGMHLERAKQIAAALAAFPQETMLADRRASIEGLGLPITEGLALEQRLGNEVLGVAVAGASRFAAGEGRHGDGTGA